MLGLRFREWVVQDASFGTRLDSFRFVVRVYGAMRDPNIGTFIVGIGIGGTFCTSCWGNPR